MITVIATALPYSCVKSTNTYSIKNSLYYLLCKLQFFPTDIKYPEAMIDNCLKSDNCHALNYDK